MAQRVGQRYSFSSRRTGRLERINKHKEAIPKIVLEVIDKSDIILEVLDARFIEDTRNFQVERMIVGDKTLIYVMNKADLTNVSDLEDEIEQKKLFPYVIVSCKQRNGTKKLRENIKMIARKMNIRDRDVTVGVVGYPNTGKSSLINVLTGRSSAKIGKESGFTKGLQKIRLSSGIMVYDTPGVVPIWEDSTKRRSALAKHAKISVRTYDKLKDPEFVVHALMQEYPGVFEKFYNINANGNAEMLLETLGRDKKMLVKGGEVDMDRTARIILKDWQEARIRPNKKEEIEEPNVE